MLMDRCACGAPAGLTAGAPSGVQRAVLHAHWLPHSQLVQLHDAQLQVEEAHSWQEQFEQEQLAQEQLVVLASVVIGRSSGWRSVVARLT